MDRFFGIAICLLIGGGVILIACWVPFSQPKRTPLKLIVSMFGSFFVVMGATGFFGTGLSTCGGLNWLPATFEWPIQQDKNILTMPNGVHVVKHTPSGRIQLYDQNWRFIKGWFVNAYGGEFRLRLSGKDLIEVLTSKKRQRIIFTQEGKLISTDSYDPKNYSSSQNPNESHTFPTSWLLWVFFNPFNAWIVAVLGIGILAFTDKKTSP